MPETFDVVVHEDSAQLTYHPAIIVPDVVPVVLDFDPNNSVGRARLKFTPISDDGLGHVVATITLDDTVEGLSNPVRAVIAHSEPDIYEHGGVRWLVKADFVGLAILTQAMVQQVEEEPEPPQRAI